MIHSLHIVIQIQLFVCQMENIFMEQKEVNGKYYDSDQDSGAIQAKKSEILCFTSYGCEQLFN